MLWNDVAIVLRSDSNVTWRSPFSDEICTRSADCSSSKRIQNVTQHSVAVAG
jgi:hypothetical protein